MQNKEVSGLLAAFLCFLSSCYSHSTFVLNLCSRGRRSRSAKGIDHHYDHHYDVRKVTSLPHALQLQETSFSYQDLTNKDPRCQPKRSSPSRIQISADVHVRQNGAFLEEKDNSLFSVSRSPALDPTIDIPQSPKGNLYRPHTDDLGPFPAAGLFRSSLDNQDDDLESLAQVICTASSSCPRGKQVSARHGSETSKDGEDIAPTVSRKEEELAALAGEAEIRDVPADPDTVHTSRHEHGRELLRQQEVGRFEARFLNKIGMQDEADGGGGDNGDCLTNVTHVCHLYKGFLALTDVLRGTVSFATPRGHVAGNFVSKPGSEPWCSCVAPNGHLAVTLRQLGCVTVWSGKGALVREFGYGVLTCPTSIACDRRGRFVVTDDKTNMVALFTPSGQFITYLRSPRKAMTNSDMSVGLARSTDNVDKFNLSSVALSNDVDASDATATLDTATFERNTELPSRVKDNCRDPSKNSWETCDVKTKREPSNNNVETPYVFSQPRYVCVTASGKIVVSDAGSHSLKIFDPDGNFLRAVGSFGSGDGQLKAPYGVCSDQQENIFVADYYNNRVSVFTIDGKFIQHVLTSSSGLSRPRSVALRPAHDRKLYVAHGGLRSTEVLMYRLREKNNGFSVTLKFDL